MGLTCPRCDKLIDIPGERPTFCPYCGIHLSKTATHRVLSGELTSPYVPTAHGPTSDSPPTAAEPGNDGVPTTIGGYRLTRLIGSGGMGAVYEGVGDNSGQRVAVKLLSSVVDGHGSVERFRQEGRLASQLTHPNCVFVLQADEEAGTPYIVMELMPGETLRDYVRRRGPLPAAEAVAKILQVIDGLIEAHRLNILHRDVKPSNCFVMSDGHVKIGDFGLSKSLTVDAHLTQSGSFLGTVMYAAPEQIRGEPLDFTADVYSVCATLYYLLTGHAPFQHENPTVVISRVISEDPPDIQVHRPDIERRLQRIVMRGLDRHPEKRFQSLEELRAALAEQVCRPLAWHSLGPRIAALVIDIVVLMPIWIALTMLERTVDWGDWPLWLIPAFIYFAGTESVFGCSIGKWVMRLRVRHSATSGPADLLQIAVRTTVFLFLSSGLASIIDAPIAEVVGGALIVITMHPANGLRGIHELASATRVMQLPWPRNVRRLVPDKERRPLPMKSIPEQLPRQFGPYRPTCVIDTAGDHHQLLVIDTTLRRDVQLYVRPANQELISDSRKSLTRPTRTRWLAGGVVDQWAWDAFLAPTGPSLPEITSPQQPLRWPETLAILEQLSSELVEAKRDGTLRQPISVESIHVRPDGRLQLADPLSPKKAADSDEITLLRNTAVVALEGQARSSAAPLKPIRAILPLYAAQAMERLMRDQDGYASIEEFRESLRDFEIRPAETTTPQRLISLGFQALLLSIPLAILLGFTALFNVSTAWPLEMEQRVLAKAQLELESHTDRVRSVFPALHDAARYRLVENDISETRKMFGEYAALIRRGLNAAERLTMRFIRTYWIDAQPKEKSLRQSYAFIQDLLENRAHFIEARAHHVDNYKEVRSWMAKSYFIVAAIFGAATVVWSIISRGGIALWLTGLTLVRSNGRPASRWQCAVRAAVVWAPPLVLLCLCLVVKVWSPQLLMLHTVLWWVAVMLLVSYGVVGVLRPGRGYHDQAAGVFVVPR